MIAVIAIGLGGCAADVPRPTFPQLTEIQARLGLSDADWDEIVGAVSECEGMLVYDASIRHSGAVEVRLIDTRSKDAFANPAIVLEKRAGTWVVTKGPEAGLVWRGPFVAVTGPEF